MPTAEDLADAGLYDPDADPPDRLDLLHWLSEQGFTLAEMRQADDFGRLEAMAADRRLLGGQLLTVAEAARHAGLDEADLVALASAMGIVPIWQSPSGELGLSAAEAEALAIAHDAMALFSPEEGRALARVMGSSIGQIGEAAVSSFMRDIEAPHIEAGGTALDLAQRAQHAIGSLDSLTPLLDALLRRHATQAIDRAMRTTVEATERFAYRYAVGFVDLVGFTAVAADMSSQELSAFLTDFEGTAHELVTESGARIVKLIGDEVMFAAVDPNAACRAAHALMSGFTAGDDVVVPRGGLSYGDVLVRGGDYFGSNVNLAARLADTAVPRELLVTTAMAEAATECRFEPAGRRHLKGFDEPVRVHAFVDGD